MRIEQVDPFELGSPEAEELAAITKRALAVDAPAMVPPSAEGLLLEWRHGYGDFPVEALWVASLDGRVGAHAALEVSHWDNKHIAFVWCDVDPAARRRGVGTALLTRQEELARELGRTCLMTFMLRGTDGERLLTDNGFQAGMYNAQRRLHLDLLDYAHIGTLAKEAEAASGDYELVYVDGPVTDDLVAELTDVYEAINDAPREAAELEPDLWPADRIRRVDAAMRKRRQPVYRVLARCRRTAEWAGHTILCVDETRPGYAAQEDTTVVAAHRGHRLGLRLKSAMLLWMRELRPELTIVDTWNTESNRHMIAVNDALGCEVVNRSVALQKTL